MKTLLTIGLSILLMLMSIITRSGGTDGTDMNSLSGWMQQSLGAPSDAAGGMHEDNKNPSDSMIPERLTEDQYQKVLQLCYSAAAIPRSVEVKPEDIRVCGQIRSGTVLFIEPEQYLYDEPYKARFVIGPFLFEQRSRSYPLFVFDGDQLVKLDWMAFRDGVISSGELREVHRAVFADAHELERLFSEKDVSNEIGKLISSDGALLCMLEEGRIRTGEEPEVSPANASGWPEEIVSGTLLRELYLEAGNSSSNRGIQIFDPEREGYALTVSFPYDRYGNMIPSMVLDTPYGAVGVSSRSIRGSLLYEKMLEIYSRAAEEAGIPVVTMKPEADAVFQTDMDGDEATDYLALTMKEGVPYLSIWDIRGERIYDDDIPCPDGLWGYFSEDGKDKLIHYNPDGELLESSGNITATIYSYVKRAYVGKVVYPEKIISASWELVSGCLEADAGSMEKATGTIQEILENSTLLCIVRDGEVFIASPEDETRRPEEEFTGLRPFYDAFTPVFPGISDESVPLSERLETLKTLVKTEYDRTHVMYTVTSAYGSIQALNLTDDNAYQNLLIASLSPEEIRRFESMESFPWLEADLTSSGSFSIKPGPGLTTIVNPLTGAVCENVMTGRYEAYKLIPEDLEFRLRSWQEAEEGQRYIIAAGGMGEDGTGSIVFGVIQHKDE